MLRDLPPAAGPPGRRPRPRQDAVLRLRRTVAAGGGVAAGPVAVGARPTGGRTPAGPPALRLGGPQHPARRGNRGQRVPQFPWETLLAGRGTAMERAWVYLLLLRQQGIDAAILAVPRSSSGRGTPPAARPAPAPGLVRGRPGPAERRQGALPVRAEPGPADPRPQRRRRPPLSLEGPRDGGDREREETRRGRRSWTFAPPRWPRCSPTARCWIAWTSIRNTLIG